MLAKPTFSMIPLQTNHGKCWFLPRFPTISHEFGETSGARVAVSVIMERVGDVGDVGQQNSRVLDFRGLGFRV